MGTSDANTTGPFLDNFVSGKTGMIIMANWWESALKSGMGAKFEEIGTAPRPRWTARRQIAFDLVFVDDRGQRQGGFGGAKGCVGLPVSWLNGPKVGTERRLGDGRNPGFDGHSAVADVGRHGVRRQTERSVPQSLCIAAVPSAVPFPVVLGGQEFSEALQQHIEAVEFGKESAANAAAAAQADAASILAKAAKEHAVAAPRRGERMDRGAN